MIVFYAIGAFVGWAYRSLQLPVAPLASRRLIWWLIAVVGALALLVSGWIGRDWQIDQRELLGMPQDVPWLSLPLLFLGSYLLGCCWGSDAASAGSATALRECSVATCRGACRFPSAVLATALVTWWVVSGVLVNNTLELADAAFSVSNDDNKPGVSNPDSPYRSGGPESGLSWDSMGREGRAWLYNGVTANDIQDVTGDTKSVEPVRVFVGLKAADTAAERADLAVQELDASVVLTAASSR